MPAQRIGTAKAKDGYLPALDDLREEDLSQLAESLVKSKEKRQEVWKKEIERINAVPDDEGKEDSRSLEDQQLTPILALRSILAASVAPRASSASQQQHLGQQNGNQSGSSTPSRSVPSSKSGSRTPMDDLVSVQMVYQAAFCFWLFSFDEEMAQELNGKFGIIPLLADVARNAVKEKVVRVIVATMRNLAEKAPNASISAMLGSKCLPLMESLSARKWSDEEIGEDVDAVKELLSEKLKGMSNYDQYISELASGRLTWDNPAHSLDEFWKENTGKLLEPSANEDHPKTSGITMLIDLLAKEDAEPSTLAIACNDVGKVITFSPEAGKRRVEKEGGKAKIMQLMTHSDGEVKFYALNTVSKLVSASWRA